MPLRKSAFLPRVRPRGLRKLCPLSGATEALNLVREQSLRPDVLLCDYNLRGSPDGIETIRHLRAALGRNVPATVMTGDTRSQTVDSISAQGLSVLIKPFSAEELLEALRGREKREYAAGCPA
jgi:CheY-like chemotaxis protein